LAKVLKAQSVATKQKLVHQTVSKSKDPIASLKQRLNKLEHNAVAQQAAQRKELKKAAKSKQSAKEILQRAAEVKKKVQSQIQSKDAREKRAESQKKQEELKMKKAAHNRLMAKAGIKPAKKIPLTREFVAKSNFNQAGNGKETNAKPVNGVTDDSEDEDEDE
jgi:DNA repair exonuclease SbcCD ATPase subunit